MLLQFIIYILYGIPSAILNILLIICIRRIPEFRGNSFYSAYVLVLFVYLLTWMNTYIMVKPRELLFMAPLYDQISTSFLPIRLFWTFQFSAFHIQQLALILMHLNRFTAVWFPLIHHKLWKPVHFRLAAISIFLIGFAFNFENFFVTGYYVISTAGVAINPINRSLQVPISFWAEKTMGHVYPTVSVLINVTILLKLLHMRASGKNISAQKSIEINLLMICLASLFCQLALMCYVDFAPSLLNQEIWFLTLNFVSDFSTLSEAWIGLAVNGVLRRRLIQWLRPSFSSSPIIFAEVSSNFLLRNQIPRRLKPINTN